MASDDTHSHTVQAMLLADAQQEIASLRADLYAARRLAEERRQSLVSQGTVNQQLSEQVQQLEAKLVQSTSQLELLRGIDEQLSAVRETNQKLQRELYLSTESRKILDEELAGERKQRHAVEQAKSTIEAERSRLQKSRDELATQLRLAQKIAREAEEEQLNAETEAATLKAEIESLKVGHLSSPVQCQQHLDNQQVKSEPPALGANSNYAMIEQQLENERHRASVLMGNLHSAKAEVASLHEKIAGLQKEDLSLLRTEQEEVSDLRSELIVTHEQLQQLQHQLQMKNSELAETMHTVEAFKAEAAKSEALMHEAESAKHISQQRLNAVAIQHSQPQANTIEHVIAVDHSRDFLGEVHEDRRGIPSDLEVQIRNQQELVRQLDQYQAQVQKLKASRDKLLEEIDSQWEEMDRMGTEHRAVSEDLQQQRRLAAAWEAQAQDALKQIDLLKGLLEESATWTAGSLNKDGDESAPKPSGAEQLASLLLKEKARSAELELGARALAAELVRAQAASVSIGRSVLPMLCGIEYRMGDMCGRASSSLQQWKQRRLDQQEIAGNDSRAIVVHQL